MDMRAGLLDVVKSRLESSGDVNTVILKTFVPLLVTFCLLDVIGMTFLFAAVNHWQWNTSPQRGLSFDWESGMPYLHYDIRRYIII